MKILRNFAINISNMSIPIGSNQSSVDYPRFWYFQNLNMKNTTFVTSLFAPRFQGLLIPYVWYSEYSGEINPFYFNSREKRDACLSRPLFIPFFAKVDPATCIKTGYKDWDKLETEEGLVIPLQTTCYYPSSEITVSPCTICNSF